MDSRLVRPKLPKEFAGDFEFVEGCWTIFRF